MLKNIFNTKNKIIGAIIAAVIIIGIIIAVVITMIVNSNSPEKNVENLLSNIQSGDIQNAESKILINGAVATPQTLSNNGITSSVTEFSGPIFKSLFSNADYKVISKNVNGNSAQVVVSIDWYSTSALLKIWNSMDTSLANTQNDNVNTQEGVQVMTNAYNQAIALNPNLGKQDYILTFDLINVNGDWYVNIDKSIYNQINTIINEVENSGQSN